jgi:putative flippase GtrA
LTGYLLRFATVGVLNTLLGYAVIFLCMYVLGQGAVTSNVIGYAVGLLVSFVLNRIFTFRSTSAALPEALRFLAIFVLAYLANLGVLMILIGQLHVHEGLSQVLAGVVYFVLSFALSKYYVFKISHSDAHTP